MGAGWPRGQPAPGCEMGRPATGAAAGGAAAACPPPSPPSPAGSQPRAAHNAVCCRWCWCKRQRRTFCRCPDTCWLGSGPCVGDGVGDQSVESCGGSWAAHPPEPRRAPGACLALTTARMAMRIARRHRMVVGGCVLREAPAGAQGHSAGAARWRREGRVIQAGAQGHSARAGRIMRDQLGLREPGPAAQWQRA